MCVHAKGKDKDQLLYLCTLIEGAQFYEAFPGAHVPFFLKITDPCPLTWKTGKGTRASYDAAKRIARHAVHHARQEADKKVHENIDPKSSEVNRLANQFRRENADVVGDKPVKNDAGEMSMSEDSKQKALLEHYQRLLNVEFDWDPDHLSDEPPVEGPPIPITI